MHAVSIQRDGKSCCFQCPFCTPPATFEQLHNLHVNKPCASIIGGATFINFSGKIDFSSTTKLGMQGSCAFSSELDRIGKFEIAAGGGHGILYQNL